jgi:hypothetical protein
VHVNELCSVYGSPNRLHIIRCMVTNDMQQSVDVGLLSLLPCFYVLLFHYILKSLSYSYSLKAVSRRRHTAEASVRSRVSPSGICGGQSGTGTVSSPVLLFAPVRVIPATLQSNLHFNIVLIGRKSGRSLGSLKKLRLFVGNRVSIA